MQMQTSQPLSLNLSAAASAIKGSINDSNDDEEEWVAKTKVNQSAATNRSINFDGLLKF